MAAPAQGDPPPERAARSGPEGDRRSGQGAGPLLALTLWPNRSLTPSGSAGFLLLLAGCLSIPLIPLLGSAAAWALLPFLIAVLVAVYAALRRNFADGCLTEELTLWPDLITVVRREPRGTVRRWHADPRLVTVRLSQDARIEQYLTLKGNGREIELGAFLSPEERQELHREITDALRRLS
jgi:uncharacterized membrane protein